MSQPTGVAADGTKVILGRGAVYFDRWTAGGVAQGERFLGNCSAFEVSGSEELKEKVGVVDSSNPLLARVSVKRTLELAITLNEFDKDNIALALLGTATEYTQAATPVTGETLTTSSVKGNWYKAAKRKLTAVAVKVSAVTKTVDVDYTLDAETGRIRILASGTIADGSTVLIDYTPTAIVAGSGIAQANPLNAGTVQGFVRFVGDPMTGPVIECELWKVVMSMDGNLSLIGDEFAEFRVKGTVLTDAGNHPNEPFGRIFKR